MSDQASRERQLRYQMVDQIAACGITDDRILSAFRKVRRHLYLPPSVTLEDAYGDHPVPIGRGQTISQPYIVAYMTASLDPKPGERMLDLGTGSGYQAAILAELDTEVYSVEIVPELARRAARLLQEEGYDIHLRQGDAKEGWPEEAPFDGIVAACAAEETPAGLLDQLAEGGRMILPVGTDRQQLVRYTLTDGEIKRAVDLPVRFVPMI